MIEILTEEELYATLDSLELVVQEMEDEYAGRGGSPVFRRELAYTASVVRGMLSMCAADHPIANKYLDLLNRLRAMDAERSKGWLG